MTAPVLFLYLLSYLCNLHFFYFICKSLVMPKRYNLLVALIKEIEILKLWVQVYHKKEQFQLVGRNVEWLRESPKMPHSLWHLKVLVSSIAKFYCRGRTYNSYIWDFMGSKKDKCKLEKIRMLLLVVCFGEAEKLRCLCI